MNDGPMARRLFVEMPPLEQASFIEQLQARRLQVVAKYQELVTAKQAALGERTKQLIADQLRMLERDIATAERALGKVEGRLTKVAAMRAMLEQGDSHE